MAGTAPLGAGPTPTRSSDHDLPARLRRGLVGPAPHHDDGEPGRPLRQPEHLGHRSADRPKVQLVGCRGGPATREPPHQLLVPDHSPRTFIDTVDVVCGVGYDRATRPSGALRFHDVRRVVSNSVSSTSGRGALDAPRLGPPGSPSRRGRRHGLSLAIDATFRDPATNRRRARLLDELDPRGHASARSRVSPEPTNLSRPAQERAAGCDARAASRACHPFCALVGVRYPIVQTGWAGWPVQPRLGDCRRRGPRHPASATMTLDELEHALAEVRSRTDAPFGVNLRTDARRRRRIELMITPAPGASFARHPTRLVAAASRRARVMPTVGHAATPRRWPAGGGRGHRPGRRGGGHTGRCRRAAHPRGGRRRGRQGGVLSAAGTSTAGSGGRPRLRGVGHRHGTRFLLTTDSKVPTR